MKNSGRSYSIGTFFGIPVKLHWTFGFIILFIVYIGFQEKLSLTGFLWLGLTVVSLFSCVVLHEYGHALTARRFGIKTTDILLTPIGGIARLNGMPKNPKHELLIAIAGPLVNVVLILFTLVYLFFTIDGVSSELLEDLIIIDSFSELILYLFFLNFMLFAFNLIPAFPMDGGRILRSLLSFKMDRLKATRIASFIGRGFAFVFVALAIWFSHLSLGVIGVFIFIMAGKEYKMAKMEHRIQSATVRDIVRQKFSVLFRTDPIQKALEISQKSDEKSFLVFNEMNQIEGVIHGYFLENLDKNIGLTDQIHEIISPGFEFLTPDLPLQTIFHLMQRKAYSILPVVENGKILGVVDRQGVMKYLNSK